MFESLAEKLTTAFARLRGQGRLTADDINDALRQVRLALLEADVNFRVVKDFVARVRDRATGQEVLESLNGVQSVIRIVHDELTQLLGGAGVRLAFAPKPPTVIMLCGLQGSGKTTTCGKLAHWIRRQGRNPVLVACDIYRPAAVRQLEVVAEQVGAAIHLPKPGMTPQQIAVEAVTAAPRNGNDVVILDTAGRLHVDEPMMVELAEIKDLTKPHETLLVVDAMTGQDAVNFSQEFSSRLSIDGFIMTKLDGDARGGAALSIRSVVGAPIKFMGVGEKMDALDTFHPDRMASRILGMGDVLSLIEKAEQAVDQKRAQDLERRLRENRFDLNDYLEQMAQMRKMGPLESVLKMIPGMGHLKGSDVDERALARQEAIVRSMTLQERADPAILNGSRKRRVAAGAAVTVQDVNKFLQQFDAVRGMIRQMMGSEARAKRKPGGLRSPFRR